MAKGVHLFPSRTQKLSPYTSKVLGWKRPGRIDSCRLAKEAVPYGTASFALSNRNLSDRGDPGRASRQLAASVNDADNCASELSHNMRLNKEHMTRA